MRALQAAARAIGIEVEPVSSADTARRCDLILALAFPTYYPWLVDVEPGRVMSWYGEPLPAAGRPTLDEWFFRSLPSGRPLDAIMAVPGVPDGPTSRLRLLRERAAWEREGSRNLRALLAWARPGRCVVVTSRPRAAALAARGIRAEAVPTDTSPSTAVRSRIPTTNGTSPSSSLVRSPQSRLGGRGFSRASGPPSRRT